MDNTDVDAINVRLGGEYVTIDGHKMFRLVWSEDIFENRHGTFREFTEAGLFIREVTETRRVRKYNYIHHRWVFEAWAPGNLVANPETPDATNGDYVPVYVFEDRGGHYLPPNDKVVRFLIATLHGKVDHDMIPTSDYIEAQEIKSAVESMDDHPAWFQTRVGIGRNAIGYSGGRQPEWRDRRATFDVKVITEAEQRAKFSAKQIAEERQRQASIAVEQAKAAERERERLARQKEEREKHLEKLRIQSQIQAEEKMKRERAAKIEETSMSPRHKGK